jgi:mono/diheme cytochrome c family protein
MRFSAKSLFGSVVLSAMVTLGSASALPFNDDMFDVQMRPGSTSRGKPKGSVPIGSLETRVASKEEALTLKNPIKSNPKSVRNGARLYKVNCLPCHGDISATPWVKGTVATLSPIFAATPDISDKFYKEKPDGHFYGIIHFGGMAFMPAYGFKLSPDEHWDIINYIRKVQNSK